MSHLSTCDYFIKEHSEHSEHFESITNICSERDRMMTECKIIDNLNSVKIELLKANSDLQSQLETQHLRVSEIEAKYNNSRKVLKRLKNTIQELTKNQTIIQNYSDQWKTLTLASFSLHVLSTIVLLTGILLILRYIHLYKKARNQTDVNELHCIYLNYITLPWFKTNIFCK